MVGVGDGSDLAPETWMGSGLGWCQGTELGKQLSDQGRADCLCCPFPFRLWHKLTHVHTLISSPPPSPPLHTHVLTHTRAHTRVPAQSHPGITLSGPPLTPPQTSGQDTSQPRACPCAPPRLPQTP